MKNTKLDTLLIIRGLLALSVVVWHIGIVNANTPAWLNIPGRTAVWMFFGISGYVIAYGFITKRYLLNKEDLKAFYINRFLRIYPLFLLLSVVTLLTEYILTGSSVLKPADIPAQIFMLQFNHEYILSGVFWTLGIEVQFYLVAPLLAILVIEKFYYGTVMNGCIYLLFILWVPVSFYFFGWSVDGRNLVSNLSHFFIGMLGCQMVLKGKYPRINSYLLLGAIVIIVFATNYLFRHAIRYYWSFGALLIDLAILSAILLHTNLERKIIQPSDRLLRFFIYLGVISYGVYAWHPYLTKYIPLLEHNTFFAVMATVLAAAVSYRLIEKPILKMKRQRKERAIVQ